MCANIWRVQFAFVFLICWLNPLAGGPSIGGISWLLTGLALAILFAALISTELKINLASWLKVAAVLSAGMGLLQFVQTTDWAAPWINTSQAGDVYANLRQRNQLASLLAMGVWALALTSPLWADRPDRRGASVMSMIFMMLCLAATGSRTGALQLVCLVGIAVLMRARLPAGAQGRLILALVIYGVCVLNLPSLSAWLGHSQVGLLGRLGDENSFSRLALWSNTIELIAQQPWTGHGWRSLAYAHYSTEFSGARFMEMLDNAHNLPLHLAVELGLPVALLFCGGVAWAVFKAKPWAETQPDRLMAWGILLVIGIHSMVEYPLWYGPFFLTALLCIMILCADLWQKWLLAGTEYAQNAIVLGVRGLGVALLGFTAFAAFDYHRVSQIYLQPQERSNWYADDALGAAHQSVLFKSHAKFAELVITPLSRESAPRVLELSSELVHWSPEPRVIEKLIESSVMMGLDDIAAFHLKRYRVAYPQAYATWAAHTPTAQRPITNVR